MRALSSSDRHSNRNSEDGPFLTGPMPASSAKVRPWRSSRAATTASGGGWATATAYPGRHPAMPGHGLDGSGPAPEPPGASTGVPAGVPGGSTG